MAFPSENEIQGAILRVLVELDGEGRPKDIYPQVTACFPHLTPAEVARTYPKASGSPWKDKIWWSGQRLIKAGEIKKSGRGIWRMTDKGRQRISTVQETGRSPLATTHEQIVSMLKEIGERVGRAVTASEGPVYKHDVLWRKSAYGSPTEVIEVCDSGNLEKDILSLQWATEPNNWGSRGFLVVVDDRDMEKAAKRLGKKPQIFLVSGSFVKELHAMATGDNISVLRAIFS